LFFYFLPLSYDKVGDGATFFNNTFSVAQGIKMNYYL